MQPIWRPSPNFGDRLDGGQPKLVVLHYTAMTSAQGALDVLTSPRSGVSAHYLISGKGDVYQLVKEEDRAWHAGVGQWGAIDNVNSYSIGIEMDNDGFSPFPAPLTDALDVLLGDILGRWDIPARGVIGHSDMAPGRKIDPGVRFDWQRLARQGLSVWPNTITQIPPDEVQFRRDLAAFGYTSDVDMPTLLGAFRLRFRPQMHGGALDETDMALARALADIAMVTNQIV